MGSTQSSLEPYITSEFSQHALLATTSVMSSIIGGVSKLPIAKIIDIWGRLEGFVVVIGLVIIGLIMKAVCQNVETYAAGSVFYWVGHTGFLYVLDIFVADVTTLRNRGIVFGLNYTPTIATTFAGPAIAQRFLEGSNFRWAFGCFVIIIPAFSVPVALGSYLNGRKAKRLGLTPERHRERTWVESAKFYVMQFDLLGMLLCIAGFSLVLLPALQTSPCSAQSSNCWDLYLTSYIYSLTSAVFMPMVGLLLRYTGKPKVIALAAVPLATLGTGLLVHFRHPGTKVGYITMCQILNGASGGMLAIAMPMAVMASVSRQEVAVVLALHGLFANVGVGVGMAIAGALWTNLLPAALWTNLLPVALVKHLPDSHKAQALDIYADLEVQLAFEWGSPVRDGIIATYGEVQRSMVIAGVAFMPLMFFSILIWKNLDLKRIEQTVGNVF